MPAIRSVEVAADGSVTIEPSGTPVGTKVVLTADDIAKLAPPVDVVAQVAKYGADIKAALQTKLDVLNPDEIVVTTTLEFDAKGNLTHSVTLSDPVP